MHEHRPDEGHPDQIEYHAVPEPTSGELVTTAARAILAAAFWGLVALGLFAVAGWLLVSVVRAIL